MRAGPAVLVTFTQSAFSQPFVGHIVASKLAAQYGACRERSYVKYDGIRIVCVENVDVDNVPSRAENIDANIYTKMRTNRGADDA